MICHTYKLYVICMDDIPKGARPLAFVFTFHERDGHPVVRVSPELGITEVDADGHEQSEEDHAESEARHGTCTWNTTLDVVGKQNHQFHEK